MAMLQNKKRAFVHIIKAEDPTQVSHYRVVRTLKQFQPLTTKGDAVTDSEKIGILQLLQQRSSTSCSGPGCRSYRPDPYEYPEDLLCRELASLGTSKVSEPDNSSVRILKDNTTSITPVLTK